MSDETRPDREALGLAIRRAVPTASGFYGELTHGDALIAADAVLAALPAPHPQDGTEALRAQVEALCDEADFVWRTWPWHSRVATSDLRALLAAAPAPTEAGSE